MHNGVKVSLAFILGAAAGAAVTRKVLKEKYEQIVAEEINSFKEMIKTKYNVIGEDKVQEDFSEEEIQEYENLANGYRIATKLVEPEGGEEPVDDSYITILSPDEFGEDEDYDTDSLILYSDGLLADDQGNLIEDVDDVVGVDSLDTFGEYEDDSIFVRNDKYKCEYEVVKDYRRYTDIFEGTETAPDAEE